MYEPWSGYLDFSTLETLSKEEVVRFVIDGNFYYDRHDETRRIVSDIEFTPWRIRKNPATREDHALPNPSHRP